MLNLQALTLSRTPFILTLSTSSLNNICSCPERLSLSVGKSPFQLAIEFTCGLCLSLPWCVGRWFYVNFDFLIVNPAAFVGSIMVLCYCVTLILMRCRVEPCFVFEILDLLRTRRTSHHSFLSMRAFYQWSRFDSSLRMALTCHQGETR